MKVYLDNCTFNRPFDNQSVSKIRLETEAKLIIQENILKGKLYLVWSYILDFENQANPYHERKEIIATWKNNSIQNIHESENLIKKAKELTARGLKSKDALHLASAMIANCNSFITTDNGIIKKMHNFTEVKVLNPLTFIANIDEIEL